MLTTPRKEKKNSDLSKLSKVSFADEVREYNLRETTREAFRRPHPLSSPSLSHSHRSDKGDGKMHIFVKTLKGEIITLDVKHFYTIDYVKMKIQEEVEISSHRQQLVMPTNTGNQLIRLVEGGLTLRDYNISNESTIYLLVNIDDEPLLIQLLMQDHLSATSENKSDQFDHDSGAVHPNSYLDIPGDQDDDDISVLTSATFHTSTSAISETNSEQCLPDILQDDGSVLTLRTTNYSVAAKQSVGANEPIITNHQRTKKDLASRSPSPLSQPGTGMKDNQTSPLISSRSRSWQSIYREEEDKAQSQEQPFEKYNRQISNIPSLTTTQNDERLNFHNDDNETSSLLSSFDHSTESIYHKEEEMAQEHPSESYNHKSSNSPSLATTQKYERFRLPKIRQEPIRSSGSSSSQSIHREEGETAQEHPSENVNRGTSNIPSLVTAQIYERFRLPPIIQEPLPSSRSPSSQSIHREEEETAQDQTSKQEFPLPPIPPPTVVRNSEEETLYTAVAEACISLDCNSTLNTNERSLFIKQGRCPTCGIQTHKKPSGMFKKRSSLRPLSNEHVLSGRCIMCNPINIVTNNLIVDGANAASLNAGDGTNHQIADTPLDAGGQCDALSAYVDVQVSGNKAKAKKRQIVHPRPPSTVPSLGGGSSFKTGDDPPKLGDPTPSAPSLDCTRSESEITEDVVSKQHVSDEDKNLSNTKPRSGEVKQWLLSHLPTLKKRDVDKYCHRFDEDGFDSVLIIEEVLEEGDLSFMKKAHRRVLTKRLRPQKSCIDPP
mmetsp:Transcript_13788/g.29606  ORF Transcript_13788/g.29606 Transcript_13788/m.29606 type:complete len:775 (+) Transcript_13788:232-2556(+)